MKLSNNEFKITYIRTYDSNEQLLSEGTLVPGFIYYSRFKLDLDSKYGYEIHNALKANKDELKIKFECTNKNFKVLEPSSDFMTYTRDTWRSGYNPENQFSNEPQAWSKHDFFDVKYKALASTAVLTADDIKLKYEIVTSE